MRGMRDEHSLRQAVLNNPDADEPRLVYADYLEENGNAEWSWQIRHQVAHPETEYWSVTDHHGSESVLDYTHHIFPDWQHPVPDGFNVFAVAYKRGFAEKLFCELPYWIKHHKEILSRNPMRKVIIQNMYRSGLSTVAIGISGGRMRAAVFCENYDEDGRGPLKVGIIDANSINLSDLPSVLSQCIPGPEYATDNYYATTEAAVIIRPHSPAHAPTDGE